jgi:hypothetical protein
MGQGGVFTRSSYWEKILTEPRGDELCAHALVMDLMTGPVGTELPWMGDHTVLQYALQRSAGPMVVAVLLQQWPWLARVRDDVSRLALHTACSAGARAECVRLVLAANPLAAGVRCNPSRESALHLALRARASPETVQLLLEVCPGALMMVGAQGTPLEVAIAAQSSAQVVQMLCSREPISCGVLVCSSKGLLPLEQALEAQYGTPTIAALLTATLNVAPRVFRAMNEGLHSPDAMRLGIFMHPHTGPRLEGDVCNVCFYETNFRGFLPCDAISAEEMRGMVYGWQHFVTAEGISAERGIRIVRAAQNSSSDGEAIVGLLRAFPHILSTRGHQHLLPLACMGGDLHQLTPIAQAAALAAGSASGIDLLLLYASLSVTALQGLQRAECSREHPCPRIAACEVYSWALFDLRAAWGIPRDAVDMHTKQADASILQMQQGLSRAIANMFQEGARRVRRRLNLQKQREPRIFHLPSVSRALPTDTHEHAVVSPKTQPVVHHQRIGLESSLDLKRARVLPPPAPVRAPYECCVCFQHQSTLLRPCSHLVLCVACRGLCPPPLSPHVTLCPHRGMQRLPRRNRASARKYLTSPC